MAVVSRYTIALHILTLMARVAQVNKDSITSDQIAISVNTNPVFIRRILTLLRKAKLVSVQRGAGIGWSLAKPADEITLCDVYEAVEQKPLFELHHSAPNPTCLIGHGIQTALQEYYDSAECAMKRELSRVTISELLEKTMSVSQKRDQAKLGS